MKPIELNFGGIICTIGRGDVKAAIRAAGRGNRFYRTIFDLLMAGF